MTNPEIELIKKWLDDPESVSVEEREAAKERAVATFAAKVHATTAYEKAASAACGVVHAVSAACKGDCSGTKYWIKRYEELTNEK